MTADGVELEEQDDIVEARTLSGLLELLDPGMRARVEVLNSGYWYNGSDSGFAVVNGLFRIDRDAIERRFPGTFA